MRKMLIFGLSMFAITYAAKADLITNGGFEAGLTGWTATTSNDPSVSDWYANNGTSTPLTGLPTVGPAGGSGYAVTDQYVPGSNALSQTIVVPTGQTAEILTFDYFINDWADTVRDGGDLQLLILSPTGNVLTGAGAIAGADLGTDLVVGGEPNGYLAATATLHLAGGSYILDFLETDQLYNNNVGLDDVRLTAVPEPASVVLLLGIVGIVGARFRRRSA